MIWSKLRNAAGAGFVLSALCAGCFHRPEPRVSEPPAAESKVSHGTASFYGDGDSTSGRKTSSGEKYDPGELTAAHPSLPIGTRARVINKKNGRSVVVRINDRGPFKKGRIIDLSLRAAQELDLLEDGVAAVEIQAID